MSRRPTVPVLALTGALGVGKTTVLNHLLAHRDGRRIGVLVNDFGDVGVDALLVEAGSAATLSLAGGCLCCRIDDDTLEQTLEQLTSTRADLDLVLVEASGVADPGVLGARLAEGVRHPGHLAGVVHVVDATAWTTARKALDPRDLQQADLIALTKVDVAGAAATDAAHEYLRQHLRPGVDVVEAPHGALDPDLFSDARPRPPGPRQLTLDEALPSPGAHHHVRACSWEHGGALHPRRLGELLAEGLPDAYRLKGVVRLDVPWGARWWAVHRVGGLPRVTPAPRAAPTSRIVAIGTSLDVRAARAALACIRRDPHEEVAPDDHAMFMRWVPDPLRPEWARATR